MENKKTDEQDRRIRYSKEKMKEYSISTLKYIQTKKTKTVKNCRFESE